MNMRANKAVAAGAADFKGWYIVVWLTSGKVDWPRKCACCGRRPETTAEVVDEEKIVARYPICRPCQRHAKVDDSAMLASMGVGALAVLGGWIAMFGFSIMNRIGLQLVLMIIAFALVTGAVYWILGHFVGSKSPRCPDEAWPVDRHRGQGFGSTLGKDAERTDEKNLRLWNAEAAKQLGAGAYPLELRNYDYARELIRNHGGDVARIQTIAEAH